MIRVEIEAERTCRKCGWLTFMLGFWGWLFWRCPNRENHRYHEGAPRADP